MAATQVWFMRHGEVATPFVGTFLGTTDAPLSDLGRHQAEAIAAYLDGAPIDAILSSPRRRARDTAMPLARSLDLDVTVGESLAEMHFGEWEGMSWPDIEAKDPGFAVRWAADPGNVPCPGGDAADAFAARVQDAIAGILDEHAGQTIAVFGHAGTNRAILSMMTGRPYLEAFAFAQDYGCINAATWDGDAGHGQVALLNLVPGPRSEAQGDGGRRIEE